jgi:hypothetical protein
MGDGIVCAAILCTGPPARNNSQRGALAAGPSPSPSRRDVSLPTPPARSQVDDPDDAARAISGGGLSLAAVTRSVAPVPVA